MFRSTGWKLKIAVEGQTDAVVTRLAVKSSTGLRAYHLAFLSL